MPNLRDPTQWRTPGQKLGLHDLLSTDDLVANGTVHLVHDLIKAQYRIKALLLHPDKNDSVTAAVCFGRIQEARNDLLGLHDMASIRSSWRKSIGSEEVQGDLYPQGLQLLQKHLETAVKSRSATAQASTSSMPSKIPLRPTERNNAIMTEIVLRNKRIARNQFVFAGGGKRKRKEVTGTIDDQADSQEHKAAPPCFSGEGQANVR